MIIKRRTIKLSDCANPVLKNARYIIKQSKYLFIEFVTGKAYRKLTGQREMQMKTLLDACSEIVISISPHNTAAAHYD